MSKRNPCRIKQCHKLWPKKGTKQCRQCFDYVCQHHAKHYLTDAAVTCAKCSRENKANFKFRPSKRETI
jgi:hypothetical protein